MKLTTLYSKLPGLIFFCVVLVPLVAFSQQQTVTGKIIAAGTKEPLAGVTIALEGTAAQTLSNNDGIFKMEVPDSAQVLRFSFVGFAARSVRIADAGSIVELTEESGKMEGVVVVGYGTQKKSDITGSVASLDRKRLEQLPNSNFVQALEGAVPGLRITQGNAGAEGNSNGIVIRGKNSIKASNAPLVVLDGLPYSGSVSDINPPDIQSIEVLKDASASAIYGSRGSNGVILITSKKGSRGKPVITYDGFYGIQRVANLPDMLTPEEFYQFKRTREPATPVTSSEQAVYDSKIFPDWVDLTLRDGSRGQHTLSVSGGADNIRYYVSATYLDVKGVSVNDNFKRLSTRANVEVNITNWLTYGTNTQLSYNNRSGLPATYSGNSGAYRLNPLTTAFNADGTQAVYPWPNDELFANPLSPLLAHNLDETSKIISNNFLQLKIPFIEGLSYRLNTGLEQTNQSQNTYYGINTRTGLKVRGDLSILESNRRNVLIENILNYNRVIGKHSISFTGLYSYQNESFKSSGLEASGFPSDVLTFYQGNIAQNKNPTANYTKEVLLSQMGRINYGFKSRYLLTLTARRDGFSGFGANTKYGFFPSVAVGWNISDESFLSHSKFLSYLKLRLSYGSNGNQGVGAYQTLSRFSQRSYVNTTATAPGYVPTALSNPELGWETTMALNAGIDFGFLNGRVQGTLDAYSSQTRDLLLDRQISSVHGVSVITQNIGQTSNMGMELGLTSTNIQSKNFTWTTNGNISFDRNKIVDIYGNGKDDTLNTWFIGYPIDVNFDYVYNGVWQTTDDFTKSPQPNTKPGYAKLVDLNSDNRVDIRDRTIIGSRQPDFIWGLGNTFRYKNLSLYVFVHGVVGTSRSNPMLIDNVNDGVRYNTLQKNWWTETNPTNEYYSNTPLSNIYNIRIYESDAYLRLRDISLSYDLPSPWLQKIKLSKFKIYVTARNALTLTKWTALDPELDSQEGIPFQKELIAGLNISF